MFLPMPSRTQRPLTEMRNSTYRQLDVAELNEPFDLCMCFDVCEHVDDYIGFLKSLTDKARYFLFNIPLDLSVRSILLKNYLGTRARYGHLHYFTRESALATLNYCGFEHSQGEVQSWNCPHDDYSPFSEAISRLPSVLYTQTSV